MNCELCGKEVPKTTTVNIEGSEMEVCDECKKYGKEVFSSSKGTSKEGDVISRIKKKRKRQASKDIYKGQEKELALDYSKRIEEGRLDTDLTQKELSKKINEKKSVIAKLERGDMRPSEELRKKLESLLDIELLEEIEGSPTKETSHEEGMTIGDLIETD